MEILSEKQDLTNSAFNVTINSRDDHSCSKKLGIEFTY